MSADLPTASVRLLNELRELSGGSFCTWRPLLWKSETEAPWGVPAWPLSDGSSLCAAPPWAGMLRGGSWQCSAPLAMEGGEGVAAAPPVASGGNTGS